MLSKEQRLVTRLESNDPTPNSIIITITIMMQQHPDARRIVFRFPATYEVEEGAIIARFFTLVGLDPQDDYVSHLVAPLNETPTKMHIILDMHCKTNPKVDLKTIKYEVYRVKKNQDLYDHSRPPLFSLEYLWFWLLG